MKKIIATCTVFILILQIYLPVMSFAFDDKTEKEITETQVNTEQTLEKNDINSNEEDKNQEKNDIDSNEENKEQEKNNVDSNEENKEQEKNNVDSNEENKEQEKEIIETDAIELKSVTSDEKIIAKKNLQSVNSENDIIELDDKIKKYLIDGGFDTNNDGKFSKSELANENISSLYIECNGAELNLSGIEYIENLCYIQISATNGENILNFSSLEVLEKLESFYFSGVINDLSYLKNIKNLKSLELVVYNNYNPLDEIENLTNLEKLYLNFQGSKDTNKLAKLTNLTSLSLVGGQYGEKINLRPLNSLNKLKRLNLSYMDCSDLSGLEKLSNIEDLTVEEYQEYGLDTDSICMLDKLKSLRINLYSGVSWVNEIKSLEILHLQHWQESYIIDESLINDINNLKVKNVSFDGCMMADLGKLDANVEYEFNYMDIPQINMFTNQNSKLYNKDANLTVYSDKIQNDIKINENKIIIIPKENAQRYELVSISGAVIKLKWSLTSDDDAVELDERIKQAFISQGVDKNGDGILTKAELGSENVKNLSLYLSNSDEIDFKGIENATELENIYINGMINGDLSYLKSLNKLHTLQLSGQFQNISNLNELTQLTKLGLNPYGIENAIDIESFSNLTNLVELQLSSVKNVDFSKLSKFTNLSTLSLNRLLSESLSGLEKLPNLKTLEVKMVEENKLDTNTLKNLNNLETLKIYTIDDLKWINDIKNLKVVELIGLHKIVNQSLIDEINNISKEVILNGDYIIELDNIYIGESKDIDLNNAILFKEFRNSESKLYLNDLNLNMQFLGRKSTAEFDNTTYSLKITAKEYGGNVLNFYGSGSRDVFKANILVKWINLIHGDTSQEIMFKDANLKQALLDEYDIDMDGRITENDMINIDELYLDEKNIKDISGLENAKNATQIFLQNNQITSAEAIANLSNLDTYIVLNDNNITDLKNLSDAKFVNIELCRNYIDLSENSENTEIVIDSITKYAKEEFEKYKEYLSETEEEFIQAEIDNYFRYNLCDQKVKNQEDCISMHKLTKIDRKEATCTHEGNIEYYICSVCEKKFSDSEAKTEINDVLISIDNDAHDWNEWIVTKEATVDESGLKTRTCKSDTTHIETAVIEKLALKISDGENSEYTLNSGTDIVITCNGTYSKFKELQLNGLEINSLNYIVESGSTKATIKANYLDTLPEGEHTIKFVYNDGRTAETKLKIVKTNTTNIENNDTSNENESSKTEDENVNNNSNTENVDVNNNNNDNKKTENENINNNDNSSKTESENVINDDRSKTENKNVNNNSNTENVDVNNNNNDNKKPEDENINNNDNGSKTESENVINDDRNEKESEDVSNNSNIENNNASSTDAEISTETVTENSNSSPKTKDNIIIYIALIIIFSLGAFGVSKYLRKRD